MGNKFFVSIGLFFCLIFYLVLGVSLLIWLAIEGLFSEDLYVIIIMIIMLLILPTFVLIYGIYNYCPKIEVTAEGMTKYLFGVKLKSYKWEEITEVKTYGNIAAQTILFYKNRKENSMFYKIKKKERIFIYCSEKKIKIIKHFAPEYIIEQLDKKI